MDIPMEPLPARMTTATFRREWVKARSEHQYHDSGKDQSLIAAVELAENTNQSRYIKHGEIENDRIDQ